MSVALLFFGLTRSLKYTLPSIQKNVYDVLKKNDIHYDVFLHTYHVDGIYQNSRANEFNIRLDNNEYKLLNANHVCIENKKEVVDRLNLKEYYTHGDPWNTNFETFDNFLLAFYSKMKVHELMKSTANEYKYVIFLRPDVYHENELPIDLLHLVDNDHNNVLIPNFGLYRTINDRFAILNSSISHIYGDIFKSMLDDSKYIQLHSESYLYLMLCIKHRLNVIYINHFFFKRVRASGAVCDYNITNTTIKKPRHEMNSFYPKICLYTVILGNYEKNIFLLSYLRSYMFIDIYIFTDDRDIIEKCKHYHIHGVYVDITDNQSPVNKQRSIKANPKKYLPDHYEYSIYIDGNVEIKNFVFLINDIAKKLLSQNDVICFRHPDRNDVYSEANAVVRLKLEHADNVQKIIQRINDAKIVVRQLTETNVLIRRHHNDITAFSEEWEECVNICRRDQISFDFLLLKHKIKYVLLDRNYFHSIFQKHKHSGDITNRFITQK
jgi:hypothetical protein